MKRKFTIAPLLLSFLLAASFSTIAQINVQDSLALVALYNSTNGANWYNNTNWLSTKPVSKWNGIFIINDSIIFLSLPNNNLSGNIPAELGNFTNLNYLYLNNNHLSGSIPAELGNLTKLIRTDLNDNELSGNIPPELGNLTGIYYLNLQDNQLSGDIPSELGNLTKLYYLDLHNNQLTGIAPGFGNLSNLQTLLLNNNQLINIPYEFGNLSNLQTLRLNNNQLVNISPGFGNLSSLQTLYLYYNPLITIPPEFGNLTNLQYLFLNNNDLISFPAELGNLTHLKYLYLDSNRLNMSIPPELGKLDSLTILNLSYNNLSGNIPAELGNMGNLELFDLRHNNLSGNIPAELGKLIYVQTLNFSYNNLSGNMPPELSNMWSLRYLSLNNNKLSGSIPPEFGDFEDIREILLDNNNLSGTVPSEIFYLIDNFKESLSHLTVQENQLTFDGIESFAKEDNPHNEFNFVYAPQSTIIALHNNGNTLSVYAGGTLSNNKYKWFKNNILYKTIKGDSTLQITEAGKYFVKVTNSIATALTLNSDTVDINILPVSLLSFTVQKQKNTTLLQWQTTSEINNSYFNIERLSNTGNFTTIGKVDALNALNTNNYSFTDDLPLEGFNYYRLKQVDKDGRFTYSKIVSADFSGYSSAFSISPNPASGEVKITIPETNSASQIIIYNLAGKKMFSKQIAANTTFTQVNISSLPLGAYNIVLLQNGEQQNLKLIKNNY